MMPATGTSFRRAPSAGSSKLSETELSAWGEELGRAAAAAAPRNAHRRARRRQNHARASDLPRLRRHRGGHESDVRARAPVLGAEDVAGVSHRSVPARVARTQLTNIGWDEIVGCARS